MWCNSLFWLLKLPRTSWVELCPFQYCFPLISWFSTFDSAAAAATKVNFLWHFTYLISRQSCFIPRGGNFHYKGIYRCAAGMGYTFQASRYMNGYNFFIKSISVGYLFHPKSIWMGKIWKIVYEWGQFSKIVYEWGQFSIWEVYEWVMFFTWPGIWMGWGSGTPAAHPYPKPWQVTPPCFIHKPWQKICQNKLWNLYIHSVSLW